jgi:hypothetical protein
MRTINRLMVWTAVLAVGTGVPQGVVSAQSSINPQNLGVVEAPTQGSEDIPLNQLANRFPQIKHSAEVAFKTWFGGGSITSAQLDKDDVLAIFEVKGEVGNRMIEADIRPDGFVEELEIEVAENAVPSEVLQALKQFAPGFAPSGDRPRIEKSIRPSDVGLPEIWFEFSGTNFDVEVRSDGKALLIEPA